MYSKSFLDRAPLAEGVEAMDRRSEKMISKHQAKLINSKKLKLKRRRKNRVQSASRRKNRKHA